MYEQADSTQRHPLTNAAVPILCSLEGTQTSAVNSNMSHVNAKHVPQKTFSNPEIQPSSVINLTNSTDVVIGPMTQYQGPVTIYQYMDATVEARLMRAGAGINNNKSTTNTHVTQKFTRNTKLLLLLIVLVLICGAVILYVELTRETIIAKPSEIYFGNTYDHNTFPNLGNGHLVVDRIQWGASELAHQLTIPLNHPVPYVLITHIGVQSKPCHNLYRCSIKMRTMQDAAIAEKNLPDIQSNFYVSFEGNVYVGRGWHWANTYANNSLAVTFIGDYERYKPSEKQLEAIQYLLAHAQANKYIDLAYKLVAQNQTKATKSPGANVYREIVKWPHFYACGFPDKPKCGSELGMNEESWNANM